MCNNFTDRFVVVGEAYSAGPARLMIYDSQDAFFYSCQQMMLLPIYLVMLDLSPSRRPRGLSACGLSLNPAGMCEREEGVASFSFYSSHMNIKASRTEEDG